MYTTILLLVLSYSTTFASSVSTQDSGNDSIFDTVTNAISSWISEFGYPAVFLASIA